MLTVANFAHAKDDVALMPADAAVELAVIAHVEGVLAHPEVKPVGSNATSGRMFCLSDSKLRQFERSDIVAGGGNG